MHYSCAEEANLNGSYPTKKGISNKYNSIYICG